MTAPGAEATATDLTIRLTEQPGSKEYVFRLVAEDGHPTAGSNLPDPEAALAVLERFGEDIFFPKPGPPRLCTQQYGGPQVALVTGTFHGRPVNAEFRRTDGCEISRWKAMAPLLGGSPGSFQT
ncbi:serine protease inhibitor [Arthrobacter sp. CDRTa11]|uniref:serine protease inhibitor n=1 Tax=Arthrobacter sp. CDRTa11 TaxID=2651199 RepID=UPI002265CA62|nr:serine protease inhibitor [Arthrobacter sp. CDRTa11]UZX01812.1 serine protease inhibitor [Arthrobacter sp. CDRTa11]